jgi:hypothetical protein
MTQELRITLPEERVDELQALDCKVQALQAVLTNLIDMHSLDNNTKVVDSPVIAAYTDKITDAKLEFERAKDAIINDFLDKDIQSKVTTWSISYSECELIYVAQ